MAIDPRAGKPATPDMLVDIPRLITAFYAEKPDVSEPTQKVAFGTSGHRGSAFDISFNENHILAISQAICEYRKNEGTSGPLFLAKDTHALSEPAFATALEVLAANGVVVMVDTDLGYTPTPSLSHAILTYNRGRRDGLSDGIVITPSHNPPDDGGFKYNPPSGGPADTTATKWIQDRANAIIAEGMKEMRRTDFRAALHEARRYDFLTAYVNDLGSIIDFEPIQSARPKLGADPLGGAAVAYWPRIAEKYGLDLDVKDTDVDPTFHFMHVDWDGKIRMDCSSPYAMAGLIALREKYQVAFANDTDADRHGVVASVGLLNPNHFLAVAINYLYQNRPRWKSDTAVGKTLVSSSMIDFVAKGLGRKLVEVPVGFKWFVDGLLDGSLGFGGEESAGASYLRRNGTVWTTDKDGPIMGLLAAEMLSRTGKDPGQLYAELTAKYGDPVYQRIDAPANPAQKAVLARLSPSDVNETELAGDKIEAMLTTAPGNGAPIGGLKVVTAKGWFAARPSGTEDVYKIYAESFSGVDHLHRLQKEAQELISRVFKAAGA
ncbi:MAG TPA: phosphoglucomutase (alpha-D-glucose-1,6-bisphosphate-dependent) [Candidatus Bathyarchaeia archaeon]|nr:phosphoglucomutase (alpha-D-glucose-1,6-bisphosphate-dependent) [Candidatus Bathyarchaeia archaeon]